jgi:soluble lytic murein transglycosylase
MKLKKMFSSALIPMAVTSLVIPSIGFASADATKVDLEKELSKLSAKNLYDTETKKDGADLNILSRMKYFEINKNWSQCGDLGAKVIRANRDLQGWVAASWLKCELKRAESGKDRKKLENPVSWLRKNQELFEEGPWKTALWQDYVQASMLTLETNRSNARVNELLDTGFPLPKDAKAQLLFYAGDAAEKRKENEKALYMFEQSLLLRENRSIRERFEAVKNNLKLKFESKLPEIEGVLVNEGAEAALEEKMNKSLKSGDLMGALKTSVVIQTEYAGSRVARRLKNSPFEIYQQIFEGIPSDEKDEKSFSELRKLDSVRMLEWAQNLHRRANYNQALIFAESALKDLYQTPNGTSLYWIAGRSAHFVGQYARAQTHYSKLIEFHSGTDEAAEALLRSGLIHLRLKNFSSAKNQFEKLIAQKRDRYDLQARYWLIRALEGNNEKERATTESKSLVDRYPYTYYGLRLNAEVNGGEYKWEQAKSATTPSNSEMFLIGDQKKAWARFKSLTKAGWLLEAQTEVQQLPITKNPWLEFQYAKLMAKSFQFPTAIRFMSDAMDIEPSLRSQEAMAVVYPKSFATWIDAEAKKQNLNPILVRSLIRQESAFGIRAMSSSNAQGLMQLIPGTAQDMARKIGIKKLEIPEDVFRPEINIPLGTTYISMMIDQFSGSVPLALAAYNAGPTRMKAFVAARDEMKDLLTKPSSNPMDEIWFDELPWTETSFYVKAILRNSLLYKLLDVSKIDWTQTLWQDLHNKKANIK